MAECEFREHQWHPKTRSEGPVQFADLKCLNCGTGHGVAIAQMDAKKLLVALTVFPATGSTTISRALIRFAVMATEANVSDMRRDGFEVEVAPPEILGTPVGE